MALEDSYIRRLIFVQRYANGQVRQMDTILKRLSDEVVRRLLQEPTELQQARLQFLYRDIGSIMDKNFAEYTEAQILETLSFAEAEAEFATLAINKEVGVEAAKINPAVVRQAVLQSGMDVKLGPAQIKIGQALDEFVLGKKQQVLQVINDGILLGTPTNTIAKELEALSTHRTRMQSQSLTRTIINHTNNQAHRSVAIENAAILDGEEWVAVLDMRTTLICAGRDGRKYRVGTGPYPPAHFNCRSVRVPVVDEAFDLDGDSTKTNRTFDEWFKSQDAKFQDEYFSQFTDGKEKSLAYRRGGLTIDKFRNETGKEYTLEEMKRLEPLAFI